MTVVTFFTLGSLRQYKCVFYEVYCKHSDKEKTRNYVVATNLGPLATTIANLKEDSDKTFFIGIFTPITLITNVIAKRNKEGNNKESIEPLSEIQDMLERNLSELVKKLTEQLIDSVNKGWDNADKYIKEYVKDPEKFHDILMLKFSKPEAGCTFLTELSEKRGSSSLPYIGVTEAELTVNDGETYKGYLGIALMPLKGNYPVSGGGKREGSSDEGNVEYKVIFQEDIGGEGVQDFISLTMVSYLVATQKFLKHALNSSHGILRNPHLSSLKLLIDTSIGLNSATVMMSQVISNALPLIYLEALRNNINAQNIDVLFYNSDPPPPSTRSRENDVFFLELTRKSRVGYHYLDKSVKSNELLPMENIIAHVREYVLNACLDSGESTGTCKLLEGIYLLRYGLIPWGLYHILNTKNVDKIPENIITIKTKMEIGNKGKELRVYYRPADELRNKKVNAYIEGEVLWLAELTNSYTGEIRSNGGLYEIIYCKGRKMCFTLDALESLMNTRNQESKYHEGYIVIIDFLDRIVNDVAKIIFTEEAELWLSKEKNGKERSNYLCRREIIRKMESYPRDCEELCRNYSCYEPNRPYGNSYKDIRNIVAHAGLTAVHEDMIFVYRDIQGNRYDVKICIGRDFPKAKLKKMLRNTNFT